MAVSRHFFKHLSTGIIITDSTDQELQSDSDPNKPYTNQQMVKNKCTIQPDQSFKSLESNK